MHFLYSQPLCCWQTHVNLPDSVLCKCTKTTSPLLQLKLWANTECAVCNTNQQPQHTDTTKEYLISTNVSDTVDIFHAEISVTII